MFISWSVKKVFLTTNHTIEYDKHQGGCVFYFLFFKLSIGLEDWWPSSGTVKNRYNNCLVSLFSEVLHIWDFAGQESASKGIGNMYLVFCGSFLFCMGYKVIDCCAALSGTSTTGTIILKFILLILFILIWI